MAQNVCFCVAGETTHSLMLSVTDNQYMSA